MRLNEKTAIYSSHVLLVPYFPHHVPRYHHWMGDPYLLETTASERLTLEEEYAMQKSWREDQDKLTFIICLPRENGRKMGVHGGVEDSPERMVGDINLFLSEDEDNEGQYVGEVEIMIAEKNARGNGLGKRAGLLFLGYVLRHKAEIAPGGRLAYLRVKINEGNDKSLALFQKLRFQKVGEKVNYFGEWELRAQVDDEYVRWVEAEIGNWTIDEYVYSAS